MHWTSRYIGLPYRELGRDEDGYDCWGLATLVYRYELGVDLPEYIYALGKESTTEAVELAQQSSSWEAVTEPENMDLVLIKAAGNPHIGVYVERGRMLHMPRNKTATVDRLTSPSWRSRIEGYYRYRPGCRVT